MTVVAATRWDKSQWDMPHVDNSGSAVCSSRMKIKYIAIAATTITTTIKAYSSYCGVSERWLVVAGCHSEIFARSQRRRMNLLNNRPAVCQLLFRLVPLRRLGHKHSASLLLYRPAYFKGPAAPTCHKFLVPIVRCGYVAHRGCWLHHVGFDIVFATCKFTYFTCWRFGAL